MIGDQGKPGKPGHRNIGRRSWVPSDAPSAALSIGPGLVVLRATVLASSLSSHIRKHRRCEVTGVESMGEINTGSFTEIGSIDR